MKKILAFIFAVASGVIAAQSDTLFLKNGKTIASKIIEVNEFDIKYKRADLPDGPTYNLNKESIKKIKYSNGVEESVMLDELVVQQNISKVLQQRQVIKFHVFDIPTGKISFGFEQVHKVGFSTDYKFGMFNSNLMSSFGGNDFEYRSIYNPYGARFAGGTFVRAGAKFLIGQDFTNKGTRRSHPLAGHYFRFEALLSYIQFEDIKYHMSVPTPSSVNNPYPQPNYIEKKTDCTNYNYGFTLTYGRQFVLDNMITLEYYIGLGYCGSSYSFTQNDFGVNGPIYQNNNYYYNYNGRYNSNRNQNLLVAQRLGSYVTDSAGFSIGYILNKPAKKLESVN